ncbi:MAG TPA: RtcB family protein [Candidatus Binataceae bacterium]|nr:RtcB family protein [Candidatus Binataceae bacterium]
MRKEKNYLELDSGGGVPIRAWIKGVAFEAEAEKQLRNSAQLPFIFRWIAAMPDVHMRIGATVGSVIPTRGAIIPAAVGVDIGCGMAAVRTSLVGSDLPDDLKPLRTRIEKAVPHGRTDSGGRNDIGAWRDAPEQVRAKWPLLEGAYKRVVARHPKLTRNAHPTAHLGTIGTGNHFIEVCLDESDRVWLMLHSGSRGIGNRIGSYFIETAKNDMRTLINNLPDKNLAYLEEGTQHFDEYLEAVGWAQNYARINRELMMDAVIQAVRSSPGIRPFTTTEEVVNCHHNYVEREMHFGQKVFVTRKGAVRAGAGDLGIIPGSMGARSYIVRGQGNPDSFMSCSHGSGRAMSRSEARRRFTLTDHEAATAGIECRKDADVIDETPAAYKPIDAVMAAQKDLVEVVHTLHQVLCVKG